MNEIDTRVVEMQFENGKFERDIAKTIKSLAELDESLDFKNTAEGFNAITNAANNVSLQGILNGVEGLQNRFSFFGSFVYNVFENIANRAIDAGQKIVNAFTIQPVMEGFQEYNLKTTSTQTLLNNVKRQGNTMDDVSRALDILNTYADKTIYNYAQMVQTMSGASNAGLNIDELLTYTMGLSNLAAYQGVDNTSMHRAGYQINQALMKGYFDLIDWKSVQNANLGTDSFISTITETARENSLDIDSIISEAGSFNESLTKYKWLTKDIFLAALSKYTDESTELGQAAYDSAIKTKTLSESLDQIKESLGSGWTKSFEVLIGNVEQAKIFWSTITNGVLQITDTLSDSRNELLSTVMDDAGGRQLIIDIIQSIIIHVQEFVTAVGKGFNAVFGDLKEYAPSIIDFLTAIRDALSADYSNINNMNRRFKELGIITNIAKGAATAVKVLITALKGIGIVLKPVVKIVGELSLKLLGVAASAGEFIFGLGKAERAEETFVTMCNAIASAIEAIPEKLNDFKNTVIEVWETIRQTVKDKTGFDIAQPFIDAWNAVSNFIANLKTAFEDGSIWSKIQERVQPILDFFGQFKINVSAIDVGETIGNIVSDIILKFEQLKNKLDDTGLPEAFENLGKLLEKPINFIARLFDKLLSNGENGTSKTIFDFTSSLEKLDSFFANFGENFKIFLESIYPFLKQALDELKPVIDPLLKILAIIMDELVQVFDTIKNKDLDPQTLANIGVTSALFYVVIRISQMSKTLDETADALEKALNSIAQSINKNIGAIENKLKSETFKNVAFGIAALVGSLVALSYVNTDSLASATAAILLPLGAILGIISELASKKDDLDIKVMLFAIRFFKAFGTAMLEMSVGLYLMSKNDKYNTLASGGIIVLLVETIANILNKLKDLSDLDDVDNLMIAGKMFKTIGFAIMELAAAVWLVGQIGDPVTIMQAWGVVEAMIGTLIGAVYLLSKQQIKADPEVLLIIATSMIALAWAVDMIVGGLLALTLVDMGTVYQAFNIIVGISGIIGGIFELTLILMNYTAKETNPEALVNASVMLSAIGSAMIMIAIAIDIVVLGVIALASVPISEHQLSNALGMVSLITIIMGILTGVMAAISLSSEGVGAAVMLAVAGGMIMMAAAIDVVVAGIIALGIALKDFEQAGIGFDQFMGVFGAVMIFSAVMAIIGLMSAGVGGVGAMALAVTLLIIAGAIALMAPALQKIGQMNDSEYIKGLILLAAVAIIFAVLAGMMLLAAPQALILSVAAISIGVSVVLLGAAFVELAFGLSAIAAAGTMALPVLVSVFAAISSGMMQGFVDGLEVFLKRVPELVPLIVDALWAIADGAFTMLINLLVWNVSSAVSGSVKVIIAFAKVASPLIGKLIEVLIDLLIDTLQGLNDGLEKNKHQLAYYIGNIIALLLEITIEALWVFLLKVIEWSSNAIPIIADQGAKAGVSLIDSFMEGIENMSKKITEFILKWRNKLLAIIPDAKDAAKKAGEMINGIAQGIGNATGTVWGAGEKLGNSIYNAAAGVLSINSPSKVFQDDFVGVGIIGGIVSGFDKYSSEAISSIESSTSNMFDAANSSLNKLDVTSMFDNFSPTITPVVDLTNVENSMNDISSMMPTTTYDFAQLTGYDFNYAKNLAEENKINESKHLDDLFAQLNDQEASLADAILNANADTKIYLDKDILVGSTYRDIDKRLGKQALLERRL